MKKLFKLIIVTGLMMLGLNAHALQTSIVLTNGVTNVVLSAGWGISKIQVVAGTTTATGTNALVKLYDSLGGLVYTNAAYTTWATVTTNQTSIYTNSVGSLTTNTYLGVNSYATNIVANTNALPVIFSQAVVSGASYTQFPNIITYKGLSATVWTTNVTLIIDYYPPF